MDQIPLSENLTVSRLIYGLWRLGDDADTSAAHVQAKLEACLSQGITTFDQADIYGNYSSEQIFGQALKAAPALRDQMQIITKCDIMLVSDQYPSRRVKHYDTSAKHIEASVNASLTNMNIEKIDVLLLHRPDPLMDHLETGACLDGLVRSGKVAAIGVSNFKQWDWDLLQSAMSEKLVTNQIEINLNAHECFTDGSIAFLQQAGIKPMAWSPLAGGKLLADGGDLTDVQRALKTIADKQGVGTDAVAVAWLLKHPATILPILGTNNLQRIHSLSDALKVEMSREDWYVLYQAALGGEVP